MVWCAFGVLINVSHEVEGVFVPMSQLNVVGTENSRKRPF